MRVILITVLVGTVLLGRVSAAADLSAYVWKNRLLLVFAPSADTPAVSAFYDQLHRQTEALRERDLLVLASVESGPSTGIDKPLAPSDARDLRSKFGILTGQFRVVLVGKDGGVKAAYTAPVRLQKIFERIDQMPMRKQEMRNQGQKQ